MTHSFRIGDKVRLKGAADAGFIQGTSQFATGEPCYFVEPYLPGSGRMYVGESALEAAVDPEPVKAPPAMEAAKATKQVQKTPQADDPLTDASPAPVTDAQEAASGGE